MYQGVVVDYRLAPILNYLTKADNVGGELWDVVHTW